MDVSKLLEELKLSDVEAIDEDGNTALHLAVINETLTQKKIIEVLGILLDRGVNPNIKNKLDETVLQLAVLKRMEDVIDFLLTCNVSKESIVNIWIKDKYTKFQQLLRQQFNLNNMDSEILREETESTNFVEWLISRGFDFYSKIEGQQSPLYQAIEYNLQHILPVLLKFCDDTSFVDEEKRTLLHLFLKKSTLSHIYKYYTDTFMNSWYTERYAVGILRTLLDRGLSVDAEDKYHVTPLEIAMKQQADINVIKILLEQCANIHRRNTDNLTILQMTINSSLSHKSEEYYIQILPLIMARGANINDVDESHNFGQFPICCAVKERNMDVIGFLRDNGADFCVPTKDGETLLHLLSQKSCSKVNEDVELTLFDLFFSRGCQINAKDINENTALHLAVKNEKMGIVRKLIEHRAELNCQHNRGVAPLHIAAAEKYDVSTVEMLRENGADFNVKTNDGENALHLLWKEISRLMIMLLYGSRTNQVFDLLILGGCQVKAKDKNGNSPLHLAARHADSSVIEKLIEHGADVNCRNNRMETPLYFALRNCVSEEVIKLLLEHGANVNAKNLKGQTVLHLIAFRTVGSLYTLPTLLKYGADVNAKDAKGLTVLSCGRNRDSQDYKEVCKDYVWDYNSGFIQGDETGWYGEPTEQMTIADCPLKEKVSDVVVHLTEHSIKLKAANLPLDEEITGWCEDFYKLSVMGDLCTQYYEKCLREVETLKSTFIDKYTSLYTFLHMNLNSRCVYVNNEKLKNIVDSPALEKKFSYYAGVIFSGYREALMRKSLLEPAKEGWIENTKIALPDLCLECILSFLSNADLFNIIEKD